MILNNPTTPHPESLPYRLVALRDAPSIQQMTHLPVIVDVAA
jgi:3-deoxy-D-arabino-heptulosonate 7-phosphate (DAHP) synthase